MNKFDTLYNDLKKFKLQSQLGKIGDCALSKFSINFFRR